MLPFVMRRLFGALPILFGVSVLTFALVRLVPGDIADMLTPPGAPPAVRAEVSVLYGLDRPVWEQYLRWAAQVLRGNLGTQMTTGRPVAPELAAAVANTLQITVFGGVLGFALGIGLGALAARHEGRWQDTVFSVFVVVGTGVPSYWLALLLVGLFSVQLGWLPAQGMGPPGLPLGPEQWRHMVLPVVALALIPMGVVGRIVRSTVLDVAKREYVGALAARGLRRRRIALHVAKNVAPPLLAVMGLQVGYLLGGSILVETVFNWPGTGLLLNRAIFGRDTTTIQGTLLVLATLFLLVNLLVDVLQAAVDPRMRR